MRGFLSLISLVFCVAAGSYVFVRRSIVEKWLLGEGFPWRQLNEFGLTLSGDRTYALEHLDFRVQQICVMWMCFAAPLVSSRVSAIYFGLFGACSLFAPYFLEKSRFLRLLAGGEPYGAMDIASAPLFATAAIIMAFRALRSSKGRLWALFVALAFFVLGGEEASWGQHWLGFSTPQAVAAHNLQGEFNIHNQVSTMVFNSLFLIGSIVLFGVVPLIRRVHGTSLLATSVIFFALAAYFLVSGFEARKDALVLESVFDFVAAFVLVAACVCAKALINWLSSRSWTRSLIELAAPSQFYMASVVILFGAWIIYGIRLRCLGNLYFEPVPFGGNFDNELLEYAVAALSARFSIESLNAVHRPGFTVGLAGQKD